MLFYFSLLCHPLSKHTFTICSNFTNLGTVTSTSVLFPYFLLSLFIALLGLFLFLGSFFAIMPSPLSFGGGGVFVFVFCIHFSCTHCAPQSDVHICTRCCTHHTPQSDVHTGDVHTSECVYAQQQKQKQKQTLKVVKLLIKIFYLATVIKILTTTLCGRIATTTNNVKYNSVAATNDSIVFCF